MYRRLIATCILAVSHFMIFGQSVLWSETEALNGQNVSNVFSTTDSTFYVVMRDRDKPVEISFDRYDIALNRLIGNHVSFETDEINHIALFNDLIHVFGIKHNKGEDELFMFELDTLGNITSSKSLLTCKSNGGYHAHFDVKVSPNQKYCAIIGADGYNPDQKETIHTILYDNEWKEHHHKEVNTNILSQKRSYNVITVNDNGVTYILKRERKKSADKYFVYCINESGSENHHELHLKARNIVDMSYDLDTLGDLYLGGFYAPPFKSYYEGIYVKKIDPEGTEIFSKEYLLNENVINAFNSKKDVKEFGYGLRRFRMSYFGFVNDKNLILEAEHHTKEKDKNGNFTHVQNGFVVISLSNKGGFQYATPISTLQTDEEDNGYWSSHCHVNYKGENLIYMNVFGEGAKSVKEDLPAMANMYTYKISLTPNGVEKRELQSFDVGLENYALYPDFKNESKLPIIILKSKDRGFYAIGLLTE